MYQVIRTYGLHDHRYRYTLYNGCKRQQRLLSDNEYRFAVVNENSPMQLRRDASELSDAEINDRDTQVVIIQNN